MYIRPDVINWTHKLLLFVFFLSLSFFLSFFFILKIRSLIGLVLRSSRFNGRTFTIARAEYAAETLANISHKTVYYFLENYFGDDIRTFPAETSKCGEKIKNYNHALSFEWLQRNVLENTKISFFFCVPGFTMYGNDTGTPFRVRYNTTLFLKLNIANIPWV